MPIKLEVISAILRRSMQGNSKLDSGFHAGYSGF